MTAGRDRHPAKRTIRRRAQGSGHAAAAGGQRPPTWSLTVTTPVAARNLAAAVCSEHRSESPPLRRADVSEIHDHVWLDHHAPSAGLRKGQSGDNCADGFVRRGYRPPRTGHGGPIGTQITWSKATRPTLAPRDAAACSGWPTGRSSRSSGLCAPVARLGAVMSRDMCQCPVPGHVSVRWCGGGARRAGAIPPGAQRWRRLRGGLPAGRAVPPDCVILWPAWGQREHAERARFLLVLRAKGRRRVLDSWGVVTVSDRVGDPPQAATPRPLAGSALARAASTRGAPTDQTASRHRGLWGRFSPAGVVRP
jgi:hypothetical protein